MASRFALFLFAAFHLNLFLCFGLGIRELVSRKRRSFFQISCPWAVVFLTTVFLWVFFEKILLRICPWFPVYLALYPLSLCLCLGLETGLVMAFPGLGSALSGRFKMGSYAGFASASLLITMRFAVNFGEVLLLALACSGGALLAAVVIAEVRKRSHRESLPAGLRGNPVTLISMGLLSLVFSASAVIILKVLLG
jgi:hypothetical protein